MTAKAQPWTVVAVRSISRLVLSFAAVAAFLVVGCSMNGSDKPTVEVTGKITLDGKPMPKGTITFVPHQPEGEEGVTGEIINGAYSVRVPAGKQTVQFSLQKMVSTTGGGGEDAMEPVEALPPRYNDESEITMEVSADKEKNEFNYQLRTR